MTEPAAVDTLGYEQARDELVEVVRALERTLDHASIDPHGRPIPGLADMQAGLSPQDGSDSILGFGRRL